MIRPTPWSSEREVAVLETFDLIGTARGARPWDRGPLEVVLTACLRTGPAQPRPWPQPYLHHPRGWELLELLGTLLTVHPKPIDLCLGPERWRFRTAQQIASIDAMLDTMQLRPFPGEPAPWEAELITPEAWAVLLPWAQAAWWCAELSAWVQAAFVHQAWRIGDPLGQRSGEAPAPDTVKVWTALRWLRAELVRVRQMQRSAPPWTTLLDEAVWEDVRARALTRFKAQLRASAALPLDAPRGSAESLHEACARIAHQMPPVLLPPDRVLIHDDDTLQELVRQLQAICTQGHLPVRLGTPLARPPEELPMLVRFSQVVRALHTMTPGMRWGIQEAVTGSHTEGHLVFTSGDLALTLDAAVHGANVRCTMELRAPRVTQTVLARAQVTLSRQGADVVAHWMLQVTTVLPPIVAELERDASQLVLWKHKPDVWDVLHTLTEAWSQQAGFTSTFIRGVATFSGPPAEGGAAVRSVMWEGGSPPGLRTLYVQLQALRPDTSWWPLPLPPEDPAPEDPTVDPEG